MASNPFHSARESLIALFDENRKKVRELNLNVPLNVKPFAFNTNVNNILIFFCR